MKNILILMLVLAALLGVYPVAAQQTNNDDVYVVQPGDSAWRVADRVMDDPTLWQKVIEKNPFLKEKGRITRDGKTGWVMVMMHPGEKLYGLRELSITGTSVQSTFIPESLTTARWSKADLERLNWFLVALLIALAASFWYIFLCSRRDPVSSGPAIVPGGVAPENAPARFQEMAARLNANRTRSELSAQNFQVISSRVGRIWGVLNVRYANGQEIPRRLDGDRAYQAEVRFPDGKTETLYMLQGCGNDLRYGGISRYIPGPDFRFEADPEPATAPSPTVPVVDQRSVVQPVKPIVMQLVDLPVTSTTDRPTILPTGEFVRSRSVSPVAPQNELADTESRPVEQPKPKVSEKPEVSIGEFKILKSGKGKPTAYVISGCIAGFEKRPDGSFLIREAE